MAFDKVIDSAWLNAGMKKVCDAIRAKTGGSASLEFPDEMAAQVSAIDTQEDLAPELAAQDSLIGQIAAKFTQCTVTIIPGPVSSSPELASVEIDGTTYNAITEGTVVVKVAPGTEIAFRVSGSDTESSGYCWVTIDGDNVLSGAGTYIHTVAEDIEISLGDQFASSSMGGFFGVAYVTTSDTEPESTFTPTDSGGTTYKSKFADNNTDLQKILGEVGNLTGSSGGALETVTLTVPESCFGVPLHYTDANGVCCEEEISKTTYAVAKNTLFAALFFNGNCEARCAVRGGTALYPVSSASYQILALGCATEDCSINILDIQSY